MRTFPLAVLLLLFSASAAQAATYTVDRTDDSAGAGAQVCSAAANDCSLRGAIIKANADAASDTVAVPASATPYDLTIPNGAEGYNNTANDAAVGDIDITNTIVIQGDGADTTTVRVTGTGDDRIFHAPIDFAGTIEISGLTLTGGKPGTNGRGGAIMVFGTNNSLTLSDSVIKDNQTTDPANGPGGGVSFENDGTLTIANTTFSGNTAAGDRGGGIFFETGVAFITNCTFFDNTSTGGGTDDSGGGGIDNATGSMTIINSTFAKNTVTTAGSIGGAIRGATGATDSLKIKNTLFVDNDVAGTNQNCGLKAGANDPVSQGHNLSSDASCTAKFFTDATDQNSVAGSVIALTLADNGGPTPTLLPTDGGPAIDAIPVASCTDKGGAALTEDQRGSSRPEDSDGDGTAACDIGAVEIEGEDPGTTGGSTGGSTAGTAGTAGTGGATAGTSGGDTGGGCSLIR